ncbi:HU family DNA-binding protein [Streptosporangium sandarakinum]
MNKSQLIDAVAEHAELPKAVVAKVLSATFDVVPLAVAAGDPVTIPGFGTFETVERAERTGRNPQTGAELRIPASKAPKFRPGGAFKVLVADSKSPVTATA